MGSSGTVVEDRREHRFRNRRFSSLVNTCFKLLHTCSLPTNITVPLIYICIKHDVMHPGLNK
nr:unnamed protein product [Callosobruchus chinensis]